MIAERDHDDDVSVGGLQPIPFGFLGIELHTRRRNRVNGHVVEVADVAEVEATASSVTTFSVDRAATVIDEGYRAAMAWLER